MENVLATTSSVQLDRTKPLVKEFFDRDAIIKRYLEVRLPHVANFTKRDILKLFSSKSKMKHTYRINWYIDVPDIALRIKNIAHSYQVEVYTTKEGVITNHIID